MAAKFPRRTKLSYHKDHSGRAGKHVFSTDRAIALQVSLNALVVSQSRAHADVAFFAMEKVLAQPLANSTDATVVAMIDLFPGVIVPQLADVTVVLCQCCLAR